MDTLIHHANQTNFPKEVLQSEVPVLLDFWAEWCGPCRALAPVLEEVATDYGGDLKILKVNVDEERELAGRFNITSIPTLILFNRGDEIARTMGAQPKHALEAFINENIPDERGR